MPKIVDHAARRDEIALVACRVVANHGFGNATVVRIAREAGYTTGMIAHYFDSKQEIILAALRLVLRRMDERLARPEADGATLLELLAESLPLDAPRSTEAAFWTAFWGQMSTDRRLKRINAWVHREYMRLYTRCLAGHWPEWAGWPEPVRDQVLRAVATFLNGLTANAVISPAEWPAARLLEQLDLQLSLWRAWGAREALAPTTRTLPTPTRRRARVRAAGA
jgi:TetR/AcrR family transcriptional repressor of bet genes